MGIKNGAFGIKTNVINKKLLKEIADEIVKVFEETGKKLEIIINKYQNKEQVELSIALTTSIAGFIHQLVPNRTTEVFVEMAHIIMQMKATNLNTREEVESEIKKYFDKRNKTDYVG